ncbi:hypothetical protein HPB51_011659 [Rhipicephalus microplus]|uniref:Uncharacterized protein n=1 Tax=Rhipicephalus microplus TaxID=6941 RepID=A0A9J6ET17_RHIMP|nr:hypothetical protein HPB51_011659 [Rhipicephalus microplus]
MSDPPDRQKVIEKYLQGLRQDDGYSHGYLKSDEEVKLFESSLAAINERPQAWQRWLRRKENNISDPDEALIPMKHVASASNQHDFDKAVEALVDSEYWKDERFRSYFEEVWLSVKELWVMSYRLEFDVVLTTNNGIEAQNRVLKAQYVKSSSGKRSLTSLIMTVVHGYLPDKEVKFHEAARGQSSAYRQYSENVPAYLHNRPHGFVKHMLRRLVNAVEYTPTDIYAYFGCSLDNWKRHIVQRDSRSAVDHGEDDIG